MVMPWGPAKGQPIDALSNDYIDHLLNEQNLPPDSALYAALSEEYERRNGPTPTALDRTANQPAPAYPMPFGKYKGKPLSELPDSYLAWLLDSVGLKPILRSLLSQERAHRFAAEAPVPARIRLRLKTNQRKWRAS